VLLSELVEASREITATSSRKVKTEVVARVLRAAAPDEVAVVAGYLAGAPRQRRTGLGWRGLESLPAPAAEPSLTVLEVDGSLDELAKVAGTGSRATRAGLVETLFGRATTSEQAFLRALVFENLRQGAQDSVLLDGIAKAAGVPAATVRRAAMFTPSSGEVAGAALEGGEDALAGFGLVPGRPVRPMLAASAPDVAAAMATATGTATAARTDGEPVLVDRKLDGIRVQVHRTGDVVRVFTRSLDDVTERLPEVVEAAQSLPVETVVLDGEVLALRPDGRPRPFQETGSRTGSSVGVEEQRRRTPLTPYFFDILHLDGQDLLDADGHTRLERLTEVVPAALLVPRIVTSDVTEAQAFFDDTVGAGHEGVVVKSLAAGYEAGRRGAAWIKVKPRHTLDLVVLAVEWGSGRRQGFLSNIHLGAADPESGGYAMLGKTFKGMTDAMLTWQTDRFLRLERDRDRHVVHLRPEQVVEVAFDGVQTSSRYPSGLALRFARVLRYRDDKTVEEIDTVDSVRRLLPG
jgi:DNA ligase 1